MKKYLFPIWFIMIITACGETEEIPESSTDYFIIGLSYGECRGDCVHLFKLQNNTVYEDNEPSVWTPDTAPRFMEVPFATQSAIEDIAKLQANFPDFLNNTTETTFGCPDCDEGGSIHIYVNENDVERRWTLDNIVSDNPEELHIWANNVQFLVYELIN